MNAGRPTPRQTSISVVNGHTATHNIPASRLTVRWHGKYKNTVPKPAINNSLFHDSIFPLVSNLAKIKNVYWRSGDYWNNTKYKNRTFFDAADSINFFTNYLGSTPDDHLLKFTVSKNLNHQWASLI